uniref:Ig-like domain-containing protein n=1 Tax=Haplochromis burtoni TaxID=8153 RepID=A0A3Q2VUY3_HAPBU
MTPPTCALYFICLFVANMAHTTLLKNTALHFKPAHVGETLTFECQCEDKSAVMLYWYKQTLGNRPQLMSTYYKHSRNGTFQDPFNDPRFSLLTGNLLKISDLRTSDSATYYCVMSNLYDFKFCEGTIVSVKGSDQNIRALVYQLSSETLQPVHSMVLNCTVQPGTCDGEQSVYWFRKSEATLPGIIYTNGSRNNPCERKPNTQSNTCVYNLPMKSLNLSQHYCAVASCGHILYGSGTAVKDLDIIPESLLLVHFFSGALALTAILTGFLAFKLYKLSKQHRRCAETSTTCTELHQDSEIKENLHYAALRNHKTNKSRKKTDQTQSECVYSSVKEQR